MLNSRYFSIALVVLSGMPMRAARPDLPMMPLPSHWETHEGKLPIDANFRVGICGTATPLLRQAAIRFAEQLARETGIILPHATSPGDCSGVALAIECQRTLTRPALGDDESYTLEVTHDGAHLRAPTSTGVLRGLATFQQLVQPDASQFAAAAVRVEDRPRFPWRGFMLDVSRHWMPMEVIERNLDAMAAVKLNVFHWHLSDDQGFRAESLVYPKLQELGSDGHFYTQEQIRHVVSYAAQRGIRVVPEFDIPGHTTSWLVGYPELGSAPGPYHIDRDWGIREPTLDPTRESTYRFLDRFLGEMTALFPDPYFHIGGDEVLDNQWKANTAIQRFMQAHLFTTPVQLHAYFNRRVEGILTRHGKKMVGWDEILTPELPGNAVIQSWRGQDSLAAAARGGHMGLLSFGYYLDYLKPASFHYANDPLSGDAKTLTPEESARILGGEACMWSEYVSAQTVDSRVWPRLAAIAERLWSPAEVTDVDSMYDRMEAVSGKLEQSGLQHRTGPMQVLDRMAMGRGDGSLTVLAASVEAAGIHDRYRSHHYNSLEPLNRLVDAVTADSAATRRLTADAKAVVATQGSDADAMARLREAFAEWSELSKPIAALGSRSFLAQEAVPVADLLAQLGSAGTEALGFIEKHEAPSPAWIAAKAPLLVKADTLLAEVRVSAVDAVKPLIVSLGGGSGSPVVTGSAKQPQ